MKKNIICYVAGKSGGHIIPCLTFAQEECLKNPKTEVLFFSTELPLDIQIISTSDQVTWHVPLPLITASIGHWTNIVAFITNLVVTTIKAFYYLVKHRPKKIVCTSGFLSIPIAFCARLLAIPVHAYELNVEPGKATCFLARWSVTIHTCFAQTQTYIPRKKCILSTYPIRFFDTTKQVSQKKALNQLSLNSTKKTIFILGGSQGSLFINRIIKTWIEQNPYLNQHIQVIHQTGRADKTDWHSFYKLHHIPAQVFSFKEDIALFYSAADLIICRSGAGTLFEVLFFNKPCITIPLETSQTKHQVANARAMHTQYPELFTVVKQKTLKHNGQALHDQIIQMLDIPQTKQRVVKQPEMQ